MRLHSVYFCLLIHFMLWERLRLGLSNQIFKHVVIVLRLPGAGLLLSLVLLGTWVGLGFDDWLVGDLSGGLVRYFLLGEGVD